MYWDSLLSTRGPPSAKKVIARTELCGTQRVKKLHSRISAASLLLQGHIHGGEKLALLDLYEAVMKQHEAPHIQGELKLQSQIFDEATVFQQRCFIGASCKSESASFPLPEYDHEADMKQQKSESASFPPPCNGLEAAMKQQKSESAIFWWDTFGCVPHNWAPSFF